MVSKWKISTGLKDIIGKELITQEHTAIFELVKNAYDANATRVDIMFQNVKSPDGGKIMIVDDGDGMSDEDVANKWLFVGYSEKKIPDGDKSNFRDRVAGKNRLVAGSKGIGRFSADRLGSQLILYTKTRHAAAIRRVAIDWNEFKGNQEKEFQNISVDHSESNEFPSTCPRPLTHGTVLEIFPLADKWDEKQLLKLKKYLQRLVNPVQISVGKEFEIHITADEFLEFDRRLSSKREHERINGRVNNVVFEKMGIKTTHIACDIRESKIITRIVDKGRFVFETEEINIHQEYLRDISINVFYLNRDAKNTFTKTMGMRPIEFGSIFLYKNGFRIHPYGEENDDWLDLERRRGQGHSRYLSTRELIGRVEINQNQQGFNEVSSRHAGVVETEEYHQLLEFVKTRVIRWLERYVVEGLDWDRPKDKAKLTDEEIAEQSLGVLAKFTNQVKDPDKHITFNPDIMDILDEKRVRDLPEVMKNLRTLASSLKSDIDRARIRMELERVEKIVKAHRAREAAATKTFKAMEREIMFLKESQPADAKQAENYGHWIGISTDDIESHIKKLIDAILEDDNKESLLRIVESISKENQRISMVSSIISKANFDVVTKEKEGDIVQYVAQYIDNIAAKQATRINFKCINNDVVFSTKFKPLEVSIMLDNFISNSRKSEARNITIKFSMDNQTLRILFADDGYGIPNENREVMFRRGFTTTTGSGIGLSHARSIARDMGGDVKFLGNAVLELGKGACFEVVVNASRR